MQIAMRNAFLVILFLRPEKAPRIITGRKMNMDAYLFDPIPNATRHINAKRIPLKTRIRTLLDCGLRRRFGKKITKLIPAAIAYGKYIIDRIRVSISIVYVLQCEMICDPIDVKKNIGIFSAAIRIMLLAVPKTNAEINTRHFLRDVFVSNAKKSPMITKTNNSAPSYRVKKANTLNMPAKYHASVDENFNAQTKANKNIETISRKRLSRRKSLENASMLGWSATNSPVQIPASFFPDMICTIK